MLALQHPSIELLGVTTVHGNAPVDVVLDNTLRVIELAGACLPVLRRAERPLERPDFPIPRAHLPERAMHARPLPLSPARARAAAGHEVDFLIDTVLRAGIRRHLLVPLDTSQRAPAPQAHCDALAVAGHPIAQAAADLITARIDT